MTEKEIIATPTIAVSLEREPPDPPTARPPLDLAHMIRQVRGVQTFLARERERKEKGC